MAMLQLGNNSTGKPYILLYNDFHYSWEYVQVHKAAYNEES